MRNRSFLPTYAVPPGETLEEVLFDRNLTPIEFSKKVAYLSKLLPVF